MVDVSTKPVQLREAVARGSIYLKTATVRLVKSNRVAKGDVLNTARLAGNCGLEANSARVYCRFEEEGKH